MSEKIARLFSVIPQRAWLLYLVLGAIIAGVYLLLPGEDQATLYNLLGASAVVAILVGIRWHRPNPTLPWYTLAFGLGLFVIADVIYYNYYPNMLGVQPPFPSVADAFYVSSYLMVALGLTLVIRSVAGGRGDWGGVIDAAILAVGVGLLSWVFLIKPYAEDNTLPLLTRL
ncbi:MAG: diguanylate cyclase, partial [Rubrobacteraceae bacterium]|nr:diguanylate cyclase [Rubrobacteraceae bacterium]